MGSNVLLGAIADDYTGATDLAGMLSSQGVRTIQVLGHQPDEMVQSLAGDYQAIVIALKSRAEPTGEARASCVAALRQLRAARARQIYFKYCSTFDSTKDGNIGPVTDAIMDELGVRFTVAVPALPVNGRTQYLGHLFVGGELLSESPLRNHPVNPMTDANLVRHLQSQTKRKVGLVAYPAVHRGSEAIRAEVARLERESVAIALVDALADEDLEAIARATVDLPLVTAGSGLGLKLPVVWKDKGLLSREAAPREQKGNGASVLILAGSCSDRTLEQISFFQEQGLPWLNLDVRALLFEAGAVELDRVRHGARRALATSPAVLVYSSMTVAERERLLGEAQARGMTADSARRVIEDALATLAAGAVQGGTRNLVVAGGETSGAVVEALGLSALEIGEMLDPGVPYCRSVGGGPAVELFLKSGNFGSREFFVKAARTLRGA